MRFIVGSSGMEQGVFLVDGDKACNLSAQHPEIGGDLMGLINSPELAAKVNENGVCGDTVATSSITPALPLANPAEIVCLGLNYVDHVKEGGYEIPEYPAMFMRTRNSIMASGKPMVVPNCSEQLDYEVELMLVIGKRGRHINETDALSHIFGYTTFNDGSIRNYQRKTHQWTPGKNFDSTGAVGPVVVTPDELPEGAMGLKIESRVGDEILQSANTSDMMWPVAKTIALMSEFTTLEPGMLIAMGTPPGVGHARKPPRWLRPGETVDVEIEGIGICSNPIVAESDMAGAA